MDIHYDQSHSVAYRVLEGMMMAVCRKCASMLENVHHSTIIAPSIPATGEQCLRHELSVNEPEGQRKIFTFWLANELRGGDSPFLHELERGATPSLKLTFSELKVRLLKRLGALQNLPGQQHNVDTLRDVLIAALGLLNPQAFFYYLYETTPGTVQIVVRCQMGYDSFDDEDYLLGNNLWASIWFTYL